MVNLRKRVIKSKKNDFEDMGGAVEAMRNINRHFKTGALPNADFSLNDFENYVNHLISIQEEDGSWTVSASPETLSEDEKVEFITFPSFLAVGTLILAWEFLPQKQFEGYQRALDRGINSLTLEGYGEDSLFQVIEMVLMLIEAGVLPWLSENKEQTANKRIISELSKLKKNIGDRLESGDTQLSFGGDYRTIFELVHKGLSVL